MNCAACGSTITQVSSKGGGYYGCLLAQKCARINKVIAQRKLIEEIILDEVHDRISSPVKFHSVLAKVEREFEKLYSDITSTDGRHRPRYMRPISVELFDGYAFLAAWRTREDSASPCNLVKTTGG